MEQNGYFLGPFLGTDLKLKPRYDYLKKFLSLLGVIIVPLSTMYSIVSNDVDSYSAVQGEVTGV